MEYNIYCDESCHLENDDHKSMVIGAVWCAFTDKESIFERIREIKKEHKLKSNFEIKWGKVSTSKVDFYKDIINLFFDSDKLHFRALVIPEKAELDHDKYNQTHDEFYYKMYFDMLKIIISPNNTYNVYLDIKDTQGYDKVNRLHEVISNTHYDFSKKIVQKIQEVRSDEVSILQITDLLIGAFTYYHRGLKENKAKLKLIELIKRRSGYSLEKSTLPTEKKFNYFIWRSGFRRGYGNV
ncbi:Phage P1-related protein in restrction modification operon RflA [Flavobacterium psychrophilum]|uniref:DUF3800 domain-containing protein n=1 Tax=Flavobacterium psychrophilum TaxID=96345 RepID=UPI000B7C41FA|nr:DUF3800 domain-containing protein [Flavobacterium psychrophilum]SNB14871.1 Phage P1-related protein in restrction modification operon RflA [Flavobacterium psychrophilum]